MATPMRVCAAASSGHPSAKRVPFFSGHRFFFAVLLAAIVGCSNDNPVSHGAILAVDDFGDTLRLAGVPERIVSLTPASTELLFALGVGKTLVGRTRWDIWPDSASMVPDMGDGLRPNIEAILAAAPDLVLLYASEQNRSAAGRLRNAGVATLSLKVDMPAEFYELALLLGSVLGDTLTARISVDSVIASMAAVSEMTRHATPKRVVWVADSDPLIVIGGGSFLNELIGIAGGENIFADIAAPSAPVSLEGVLERDPDVIIAGESIVQLINGSGAWSALRTGTDRAVVAADSYTMGRPSVRMGEAARSLGRLLHPELPW